MDMVPKHKGVEIEDIAQGTDPEASRGSVVEIRYDGFMLHQINNG